MAWPLHTPRGEEELAEALRGEQGAVSVCTVSGEEGDSQPSPKEKAVIELIHSAPPLMRPSSPFQAVGRQSSCAAL